MGTLLLACKMMRKCQVATIPAYVIQLASRCEKGACFNWSQCLCNKFLENVREAQDHGRAFCYSWLLLLITLVAWEALEDLVLPELEPDMCVQAQYANLRDLKDEQCIEDNKIFWVLFQSELVATIHS